MEKSNPATRTHIREGMNSQLHRSLSLKFRKFDHFWIFEFAMKIGAALPLRLHY